MPRLIDKRDAIKHLKKLLKNSIMPTEWYEGAKSAITLLKKEPTVDAEPVVRCKDCQYSRPKKSGIKLHCAWWYKSVYDDDFCSRGKRREDD